MVLDQAQVVAHSRLVIVCTALVVVPRGLDQEHMRSMNLRSLCHLDGQVTSLLQILKGTLGSIALNLIGESLDKGVDALLLLNKMTRFTRSWFDH